MVGTRSSNPHPPPPPEHPQDDDSIEIEAQEIQDIETDPIENQQQLVTIPDVTPTPNDEEAGHTTETNGFPTQDRAPAAPPAPADHSMSGMSEILAALVNSQQGLMQAVAQLATRTPVTNDIATARAAKAKAPTFDWPKGTPNMGIWGHKFLAYIRRLDTFCAKAPGEYVHYLIDGLQEAPSTLQSVIERLRAAGDPMLQNFAKKDAIKEILRHLLGAEPSLILRTELDTSSQREGEPSGEWAGRLLDLQQLLHLADHPLYRAPSDEDIRDRFLFCSSTRYQSILLEYLDRTPGEQVLPSLEVCRNIFHRAETRNEYSCASTRIGKTGSQRPQPLYVMEPTNPVTMPVNHNEPPQHEGVPVPPGPTTHPYYQMVQTPTQENNVSAGKAAGVYKLPKLPMAQYKSLMQKLYGHVKTRSGEKTFATEILTTLGIQKASDQKASDQARSQFDTMVSTDLSNHLARFGCTLNWSALTPQERRITLGSLYNKSGLWSNKSLGSTHPGQQN